MHLPARRVGVFLLLFTAMPCLAETIAVRTYNTHGIWVPFPPGSGTLMPRSFRFPRIADQLAHDDIVVFEELFTSRCAGDRYRRLLLETDNHVTQITPDIKPGTMFDSGLVLVSARPKADFGDGLRFYRFVAGHGKWNPFTGNDLLAVKGVAQTVVQTRDGDVHLYFTHLDAGGSQGDRKARVAQLEELDAILTKHSAGAAVILAGDFNIKIEDKRRPIDVDQLLLFAEKQGLRNVCAGRTCNRNNCRRSKMCGTERIDHIFYRSGTDVDLDLLGAWWDSMSGPVGPLSDHPALSAHFEVRKKGSP